MKKRGFAASIAIVVSTILLQSCAKEGPTGPTGPAGPSYTGNVIGHVSQYDQYGNKVLSGLDSTYITITGNTIYASATATTISDATGYYAFGTIYTGDYNLTVTHTGYAPTLISNFSYLMGNLTKDINISAIPDSFLTSFTATHNSGSLYDSLVITATPDPLPRNCIVFVYVSPAVSNNYITGYILTHVCPIPAYATTVTLQISKDELTNAGFISGTSEVYYAAYSYVVNDASLYEDLGTGKKVYNSVNTNAIIASAITP